MARAVEEMVTGSVIQILGFLLAGTWCLRECLNAEDRNERVIEQGHREIVWGTDLALVMNAPQSYRLRHISISAATYLDGSKRYRRC